jgi:hypothetical protein
MVLPGEVIAPVGSLLLIIGAVYLAVSRLVRLRATLQRGEVPDAADRLDALEGELQDLRHQLTETQERLDFTERLLTRGRDEGQREGG